MSTILCLMLRVHLLDNAVRCQEVFGLRPCPQPLRLVRVDFGPVGNACYVHECLGGLAPYGIDGGYPGQNSGGDFCHPRRARPRHRDSRETAFSAGRLCVARTPVGPQRIERGADTFLSRCPGLPCHPLFVVGWTHSATNGKQCGGHKYFSWCFIFRIRGNPRPHVGASIFPHEPESDFLATLHTLPQYDSRIRRMDTFEPCCAGRL